jgi:hypothetical protein
MSQELRLTLLPQATENERFVHIGESMTNCSYNLGIRKTVTNFRSGTSTEQRKTREAKLAAQQRQIEALTAGLQKGERSARSEQIFTTNGSQQSLTLQ